MKINGKTYSGAYIVPIVFPRGDSHIIFQCRAVADYTQFDTLCPRPNPPTIVKPNGEKSQNLSDPAYNTKLDTWATRRSGYMFVTSLTATEGLEWDTVDLGDPATWENVGQDLTNAGFTPIEVDRLWGAVMDANGLNSAKIKQATEDFLAGRLGLLSSSDSQQDDQSTT